MKYFLAFKSQCFEKIMDQMFKSRTFKYLVCSSQKSRHQDVQPCKVMNKLPGVSYPVLLERTIYDYSSCELAGSYSMPKWKQL